MTTMFLVRKIAADCIIFRRRKKDIYERGGLLRKAQEVYRGSGARFRWSPATDFVWKYKDGTELTQTFAAIPRPDDVEDYQGPDFGFWGMDEMTHFLLDQFSYLFTRNRAPKGARYKPIFRGTCNPQKHGWVRDLVDWYIGEDGFPIKEREGVLRWVVRAPDDFPTAFDVDTEEALLKKYPHIKPLSMTFIPGRPEDNPYLNWEEYYTKFAMESQWKRDQLMHGNWNAGPFDPTKIWDLPAAAIFEDKDEDFQEALRGQCEVIGMWDYGTAKALVWNVGLLTPGAPPVLWMIGSKLWERADADIAARDRELMLARLAGELRIEIDPREAQDAGDPTGFAQDSMGGWARNLKRNGVRLANITHIVIGQEKPTFLHTQYGISIMINLVKNCLGGKCCDDANFILRIRQHPSCNTLLAAIQDYSWDVADGQHITDVNHDLRPRKDRFSHPADALKYGCSFVYSLIRARRRAAVPPPSMPLPTTPKGIMGGRGLPTP